MVPSYLPRLLEQQPVLAVGVVLSVGLLAGRLAARFRLPEVLGYILVGILVSPHATGILSSPALLSLTPISDAAIGLIVFTIGASLNLPRLRRLGRAALLIVVVQALATFALVASGLSLLDHRSTPVFACLLGVIAVAAATPTTFAIVRECACRGPLTRRLLVAVVLNDVITIVAFRLLSAALWNPDGTPGNFAVALAVALIQLLFSLGLGTLLGWFLGRVAQRVSAPGTLLAFTLASLLLLIGVARGFGLSPLLGCLAGGMAVTNGAERWSEILASVRPLEAGAYTLFFTLAGAQLDLGALRSAGALGVMYLVARAAGKYLGGCLGSRMAGVRPRVWRNFGLALLPQAAIAVALAADSSQQFPALGPRLTAIALAGVLVFQVSGVLALRFALGRAGEA